MSTETSVLLLLLVLIQEGAAIRPAVTFTPNYKKIFIWESITMTCDGGSTIGGGANYIWCKDSTPVYNGKSYTLQSADTSDSGSYQCQTRPGEISDPARLDVSNGWVILQTPLYVYEGDEINIRCHHYPRYSGRQTIFLKDNRVIRDWTDDAEYYIGNVDRTTAGNYRCRKVISGQYYGDEASVSVEELFTTPRLTVTPHPVFQTDTMTLKCETGLHPARQNTQLQFAFYREGRIVHDFSINDIYEVYDVQLEDSGKYSCAAVTTDGRVRKRSAGRLLQIEEPFSAPSITGSSELYEGDPMTLTCDSALSPHIDHAVLQFAFYRDGREVQGFNVSNKYEVQSVQRKDSGNYTCDVKTSISPTMRRSSGIYIHIQGTNGSKDSSLTVILSVSLGLLLFIMIICILLYICRQWQSSTNNPQPTINDQPAPDHDHSPEDEVNYAVFDMTSRPQSQLPKDNGSNVIYTEVNSKANGQVKGSQRTAETSTNIYQNIGSHR